MLANSISLASKAFCTILQSLTLTLEVKVNITIKINNVNILDMFTAFTIKMLILSPLETTFSVQFKSKS